MTLTSAYLNLHVLAIHKATFSRPCTTVFISSNFHIQTTFLGVNWQPPSQVTPAPPNHQTTIHTRDDIEGIQARGGHTERGDKDRVSAALINNPWAASTASAVFCWLSAMLRGAWKTSEFSQLFRRRSFQGKSAMFTVVSASARETLTTRSCTKRDVRGEEFGNSTLRVEDQHARRLIRDAVMRGGSSC